MKTIADFKRKAVIGSTWNTVYHKEFSHRDEQGKVFFKDRNMGDRKISIVQASQIAFDTERATGETVKSWIKYPKTSEVVFINENTIQILEDKTPLLTYTFLK